MSQNFDKEVIFRNVRCAKMMMMMTTVDDDIIKNVKSVNEVKAKEFQQTFVTMCSHGKSVQMNT